MIHHLSGKLIEKNPTEIIVECAGVGYFVKISLNTYSKISDDADVKVYTQFIVREDAQLLYGFADQTERDLFNLLISVSGIGPNTAILMLSSMSPNDVALAIGSEDVKTIQSIKGIGLKTAQRVIVDLKDKMLKFGQGDQTSAISNNSIRFDALTALVSLGFDKRAADKALDKVEGEAESVEQMIKKALKVL
jgi:Holliday junction DNA helicase RuvA